ncbi:hypothetical protein LKF67_2064 [Lactococcus lactis subsp. lactis]|nr:hypothetical protein ATCC19435_2377 [Lactococcus lactis subsp. lactis]CDI45461.1 hypothetical protein BN927_01404 [Lactococcus lactis subsp. lactis Dephy 1]KST85477.1 hypothetical protein KF7_1199 [Lactococcus lactis subsp. lactis]KST88689.1 hypothetical protein LKF67_2064 [Lactococcus lactis subsp. lactis]KST92320.1 hypothetical protein KF134_0492 [Lactococcus lactis subsp. lactis]
MIKKVKNKTYPLIGFLFRNKSVSKIKQVLSEIFHNMIKLVCKQ